MHQAHLIAVVSFVHQTKARVKAVDAAHAAAKSATMHAELGSLLGVEGVARAPLVGHRVAVGRGCGEDAAKVEW